MADISKIKPLGSDTTYDIKDAYAVKTVATGDGNGQIKITPRSGSAYNVDVKGLAGQSIANGTTSYLAYYSNAHTISPTKNAHFNWSDLNGTTKGYEELVLGNKTDRFGRLALYGQSDASGGAYIIANNPTSWLTHTLPDKAGWIVTAGNGSTTGAGGARNPVYVATTGVATAGAVTFDTLNANRLMWTSAADKPYAGYHYANSTKIAINSSSEPTYNLYVNGTGAFSNALTLTDNSDAGKSTINFSRVGYNYINIPTDATLAVSINGSTGTKIRFAVDNTSVHSYTTNSVTLGTSSIRWKALYIGTADSYGGTEQPIYWNAGVPTATTYALKATVNNATQWGVAYYSTARNITSTAAGTAGYPLIGQGSAAPAWYGGQVNAGTAAASWITTFNGTTASTSTTTGAVKVAGGLGVADQVTATRVGAGGSNTSYTLYVNGNNNFNIGTSDTTANKKFIIVGNNRYLSIGGSGVQAYSGATNTNTASLLYLQYNGGNVQLGQSSTVTSNVNIYGNIIPQIDLTYNLGSNTKRFLNIFSNCLELSGPSSDPSATAGGRIKFSYDAAANTGGSQPVYISYTPNDNYRAPAGLKIFGGTSATPAWLEVEGKIISDDTTNSTSSTTGSITTSGGLGVTKDIFSAGTIFANSAGRFQKVTLLPQTTGPITAGWYRTCKVSAVYNYANFLILFSGDWSTGAPTVAIVSVAMRNGLATMKLLHGGFTGNIQQIRLIKDATNTAWLETYIGAWADGSTLGSQNVTFIGNVSISDIKTTLTAGSGTAMATLNLFAANTTPADGTANRLAYYNTATKITSHDNLITDTQVTYGGRTLTPNLRVNNILYADSRIETGGYFLTNSASAGASYYLYSNNVQYGRYWVNKIGTAPTATTGDDGTTYAGAVVGEVYLDLGNNKVGANTSAGVANNAKGYLRIYDSSASNSLVTAYGAYLYPNYGLMLPDNRTGLMFRGTSGSYYTRFSYQTGGNEALVAATQNAVTSFIFINGEAQSNDATSTRWQSLTSPGLQIKQNNVRIGGLWASGTTPDYKLRVDGDTYVSGNTIFGTEPTKAASNKRTTINGKLVINPSYNTSNSFNEGIRINLASNGWANINFGGAIDSVDGTADGSWLVGRRGAAGSSGGYGAVGDFTIEEQGSAGQGLTVHKDAGGVSLFTTKVASNASVKIKNTATIAASTWAHGVTLEVPNLAAGGKILALGFGKAFSTGNAGHIGFHYANNNNANNYLALGIWSNNDLVRIYNDGRVIVGKDTSHGGFGLANTSATTGLGISLHNGASTGMPQYGLAFAGTATFGPFGGVTDSWATYFTTSNTSNRGWIFKRYVSTSADTIKGYNSASIRATDGVYFGGGISLYHPNKNAWCGDFYINRIGTANSGNNNATRGTQGITLLRVGNNIAWPAAGTAGGDNNSTGIVRIYAENTYFTDIMSQAGSANRTFYLPNYNAVMYAVHAGNNNAVGSATQPVYVAANGRVTACTAYASASVDTAKYLLTAAHGSVPNPTYGVNRLEYFNTSLAAGAAANTTGSPTADWYHHLRMNHANNSGYYVDIAACFHNDNIYWKRVSGGSVSNNKWMHIWVEGNAVTSAVWNDYAEYRETDAIEAGRCVTENGDDSMTITTKRLQKGCSITSDTWGFAQGETEKAKTPIAVSGRVLAYPYESREDFKNHIGDAVCSGPDGTVSIMTDEEVLKYPLTIIGTISSVPDYEEWGGGTEVDRGPVKVNGRVWIRIR